MANKILIQHIAENLKLFGFDVYLSDDGKHGFYTDGTRVVSFGGHWNYFVDFSGNYEPTKNSGTGWGIAKELTDITAEQASEFITANAPEWTGNHSSPHYTTPAQYLKTYGKSSGYKKL